MKLGALALGAAAGASAYGAVASGSSDANRAVVAESICTPLIQA